MFKHMKNKNHSIIVKRIYDYMVLLTKFIEENLMLYAL